MTRLVTIGLEIHAQVNSKTKMFCNCPNDYFGKKPNESACPVCMGFPGVLPAPNKVAIEKSTKAGLALGCEIPLHCKFDRKNYFYADLPYGYQISQFDEPLAINGEVRYDDNGTEKICRITRLHMENDAGKLVHTGGSSFCDYNRAGSPLMEIVSEPDLTTPEEASAFAQELWRILQFAGSSECNMFKGQMRFDASISIREKESDPLNARAEIKNLNSFKALEDALRCEIKRQNEEWDKVGHPQEKESTVGWNDDLGQTYFMRWKESAADYRYFPEPDIPPVISQPADVEKIKATIGITPLQRKHKFIEELKLNPDDAQNLIDNPKLCLWYEEVATISKQPKKAVNWVLSEIVGRLTDGATIADLRFPASSLADIITKIESGDISGKQGKEILDIMWKSGQTPEQIIEEKGMKQMSDTGELEKIVEEIIATPAGQDAIATFKSGRTQALGFIVGQAMKATQGQANPGVVNKIIQEKIK